MKREIKRIEVTGDFNTFFNLALFDKRRFVCNYLVTVETVVNAILDDRSESSLEDIMKLVCAQNTKFVIDQSCAVSVNGRSSNV